MATRQKKQMVLIALVIFWVGLIAVQRYRARVEPPVQRASVRHDRVAQRDGRTPVLRGRTKDRTETPRLKLARVERVRPPYEPESRNIFASIGPSPTFPSAPSAPAAPPQLPDLFAEEAKRLRFLGFATAEGKMMAFVAYGNELLVIAETEAIGSQFRVKEIKEDAVIVSSLDGAKEVVLGLGSSAAPPPRETPGEIPREIQKGEQPWQESDPH